MFRWRTGDLNKERNAFNELEACTRVEGSLVIEWEHCIRSIATLRKRTAKGELS